MNKEICLCFTALILTTIGGKPITNQDYLEAVLTDIRILLNMLPNRGGTYFTPKNTGVKCVSSAMDCFMAEINILEEENEDNRNITNIIQNIQRNLHAGWKQIEQRDGEEEKLCPLCGSYERKNKTVFLNHMIQLVQLAFRTGL